MFGQSPRRLKSQLLWMEELYENVPKIAANRHHYRGQHLRHGVSHCSATGPSWVAETICPGSVISPLSGQSGRENRGGIWSRDESRRERPWRYRRGESWAGGS